MKSFFADVGDQCKYFLNTAHYKGLTFANIVMFVKLIHFWIIISFISVLHGILLQEDAFLNSYTWNLLILMQDSDLKYQLLLLLQRKDHYKSNRTNIKGATKLYFMYYSCVVIILFSTGLYKSAFSTCSFGKTRFSSFCVLVFRVSVSLAFNFQFCSMF